MVKKQLILADRDELYLTNLSNYFMEKNPQLEQNIFTKKEKLIDYLENGGSADILAVDESFADAKLQALAADMTKIVLSSSMEPVEGYEVVKKYQKSESLLNEILLKYAESTGKTDVIRGKSNTRAVAFYSPAGGTGKTTLSLAMASACGAAGLRTFYLNLEEIDSVKGTLAPSAGTLSDVFLALKTKGMNVGVKLAACAVQERTGGFYYLSGVESISEYEEITGDEIRRLVETICSLSEYDVVIIDVTSSFSEKTLAVLNEADIVFVPVLSEENSIAKVNRFLDEGVLHERYNTIFKKMTLVVNQSAVSGVGKELLESGLLNRIPCSGAVAASPVFKKYSDIIRSGSLLKQTLDPMIQTIFKEQGGQNL